MAFLGKLRRRVRELERKMAALEHGGKVIAPHSQTPVMHPSGAAVTYINEGPVGGRVEFSEEQGIVVILEQATPGSH